MASRRKLVKWYMDQQGLVTYSRTQRKGPASYDGAGAMYSALIYADFLPQHTWIGDLHQLKKLEGSLLQVIPDKQLRRGDIFISMSQSDEQEGYTGVVIDGHRMIYCSQDYDGIVISKFRTWPNQEIVYYRLAEPVKQRETFLEKLEQCLNRYNRRRAVQATIKLEPRRQQDS